MMDNVTVVTDGFQTSLGMVSNGNMDGNDTTMFTNSMLTTPHHRVGLLTR